MTLEETVKKLRKQVDELIKAKRRKKQWLTLAEVKEEFGYEAGSIYQLVHKGKLSHRKAAGLQILRRSIEKYVEPKTVFIGRDEQEYRKSA